VTHRFRADLHVHSRYSDTSGNAGVRALRSAESFTEPLDLYHAQRARGMDFVTITDHNTLAGSLAIAHLPGTFLSAEFDTWFPENGARVHVVALGLDEVTFAAASKARASVYDLVACLREARVTHYLAHPLFDMTGRLTPETVERMLLLFNVLEGRNGAVLFDDSYNANPLSVIAATQFLAALPGESWLVLGDMKELGDDAVVDIPTKGMGAEDFPFFTIDPEITSVYWAFGGTPQEDFDIEAAGGPPVPSHHSPLFKISPEPAVIAGVESSVVALLTLMQE